MNGDTIRELLDIAKECREFLDEYLIHALEHEQETPESKSLWIALMTLGTLALDVSAGISASIDIENYRVARILCRSLSDYAVRLEYYARNPDEAHRDVTEEAPKWLRKYLKPMTRLDNSSKIDWDKLSEFIAGDIKNKNLKTKEMMKRNFEATEPSRTEQLIEYHYDSMYAKGSALSHGNTGAIVDVFSDLNGNAREYCRTSRGVGKEIAALDYASSSVWFIRSLALCSGQREPYEELQSRLDSALKPS